MRFRLENFELQRQKHSMWCWAAVSTSVDRYFSSRSTVCQCCLVKKVLGAADCCKTRIPVACNQAAFLQDALTAIRRLKGRALPRPLRRDEIRREIHQNRPVCAWIKWIGGGGHFVVICGYDESKKLIEVADPRYQPGTTIFMSYRDFVFRYNLGRGRWKGSFRLRSKKGK